MEALKKPQLIDKLCGWCGGCGHGIIQRLICEVIEELGIQDKVIHCCDIGCCFWAVDGIDTDCISGPHGRVPAVATGVKKVRPENIVFIYAGDGASYTIGMAETTHLVMRDLPVTMIVVNNGAFGMTGGQMSVGTTLIGQKTASTPKGRKQEYNGEPADMLAAYSTFDVEFLARGALYNVREINNTKALIKKGFQNQMEGKGLSLIEVLSPCPTTWHLSPIEANKRIEEEVTKMFPVKVYKDRGGRE